MNKHLLIALILLIFSSFVYSQTFVSPGDGSLSSAIEEAESGDILQLVPDALYTESTNFEFGTLINKSLTIEVEGDGSVKAKLQILTAPTLEDNTVFFRVGDQSALTLKGLEIDGSLNSLPSTDYLITMYMGEFPAPTNIKTLRLENCYIHDLASHVLSAGNSEMRGNIVVDSTFVDNSVVENTSTSVYYKYCGSNFISLTNSTFNTITSYGVRVSGSTENNMPDYQPTVIVDHTTWYNIGTTDPREILLAEKEPTLFKNPWTVTNSIFVKQESDSKTVINIKDTLGDSLATITNIAFWEIGNINFRSHTIVDTIRMDPEFADPDNGDFTLPGGSILLSYGTDGGPIGDLRWTENAPNSIELQKGIELNHFALNKNYPNPFNPATTISFSLEKQGFTSLKVYDILGREVSVLVNHDLKAGEHNVTFDAGNLNSGLYFYQLKSSGQSLTQKMMLLK